jgi:hypothetical protein
VSDGCTDAYRAQREHEDHESYVAAIAEYVGGDEEAKSLVMRFSKAKDKEKTERMLAELRAGDREAWMRLLHASRGTYHLRKLHDVSPFKDKILFVLDYGTGGRGLCINEVIGFDKMIEANGMCTHDCDKYLVAVDPSALDVRWLWCADCNINVTTPLKKDRDKLWKDWRKKRGK